MEFTVAGKKAFASTGGRKFDPSKTVVMFVHGSGMDHTVWHLQTRYFAHHGRSVLAVDLPGHGRSAGPALKSVVEMSDWLIAALDALGVAQAAVAGHSLTSFVCLDLAARYPARIRAIALCGMAAKMPVHPELQAAGNKGEQLAYDIITSWGLDRRAHIGGAEAPGMWMMGGTLRLLEQGRDAVVGIDLAASEKFGDAVPTAGQVKCPTLLLLGERDRMTPLKNAKPLLDAIPGARLVVLKQCGHMMMTEHPGATLDALKEIL